MQRVLGDLFLGSSPSPACSFTPQGCLPPGITTQTADDILFVGRGILLLRQRQAQATIDMLPLSLPATSSLSPSSLAGQLQQGGEAVGQHGNEGEGGRAERDEEGFTDWTSRDSDHVREIVGELRVRGEGKN